VNFISIIIAALLATLTAVSLFPLILFVVVWGFCFLLFLTAISYVEEKIKTRRKKWDWK